MQVTSQLPTFVPTRTQSQAASLPQGKPEDLFADRFDFEFPSSPTHTAATHLYQLPEEQAPRLQRPVLLVHGFNGAPGNWENMRTWLVRGGENVDGGVVKPNSAPVNKDANVFAMEFSRPFNSVRTNASELRRAIDKIAAATGAQEIDVVAHSMGGLDTRLYLDQGNEKVKNLVMIGTPNHGSVLADIEMTFRELGVPIKPPTDDPEVRQALTDLGEVRGNNNPLLAGLNKSWKRQREAANIFIISGNGKPTLTSRTLLTLRGDGVVTRRSSELPDVERRNIWWTNHSGVKDHPDALRMTGAFLTGRPLPMQDADPPDIPPDREIVPEQIIADPETLHYVLAQ